MNVVSPNTEEHIIKIIPRYYPTGAITLSLFNEATQVTEVVNNTYEITDGNMFVSFSCVFTENQKFQVKIKEGNEVVYRGKLIATSQDPQEYKLTNNVYYY
jgi:hypothetical protein